MVSFIESDDNNGEDLEYKMRELSHVIGLHAELMIYVRDTVKNIVSKKDSPWEIKECVNILDNIAEESDKLGETARELSECIRKNIKRKEKTTNRYRQH